MKLILTGVTGAAGSQIFRAAISDASISHITVLSRRPLPEWLDIPENSKTEVVILNDFVKYPAELLPKLSDHDACIWALGKSSAGVSEQEYTRITYDYTMAAVHALEEAGIANSRALKNNAPFRFVYISGEGADPSGKSRILFARVKGRTEKALIDLPSSSGIRASIIRPAYFFPSREHPIERKHLRSASSRFIDTILTPLFSNCVPSVYTPVKGLGLVAVELAKGKWSEEQLFKNTRMRELLNTL